jgi:hypothetical protein
MTRRSEELLNQFSALRQDLINYEQFNQIRFPPTDFPAIHSLPGCRVIKEQVGVADIGLVDTDGHTVRPASFVYRCTFHDSTSQEFC